MKKTRTLDFNAIIGQVAYSEVGNNSLYFLDHKIVYKRQRRKKIITLFKSFRDLWSQSKQKKNYPLAY